MVFVIFFIIIETFFLILSYFVGRIERKHNKQLQSILEKLIKSLENDTVKWKK